MKYYVVEGTSEEIFNASSKARVDVEHILEKNEYKKIYVKSKSGVQKNKLLKWKQLFIYNLNRICWNKTFKNLKKNDIVLIQYPIINTTYNLKKIIRKYRKKNITFVALIHDMDSLRYNPKTHGNILYNRVCKEDKYLLREFNYIIAHNDFMKNELVKLGNDKSKIITLKLFDYLLDKNPKKISRTKSDPIIIAGNLSPEKAKYLSQLKKINKTEFNLFGVGFNDEVAGKNINYKGKFLPEELLDYLEGSFGLVWDGISIDTCTGGFGDYLKYNNPHKVSLYLTACIPVIVWKKSALAQFVIENNVGIAVESLKDIPTILKKMSEDEYKKMLENTKRISKKTKNGLFLTEALNKLKEK